jgi:hypothetical protein
LLSNFSGSGANERLLKNFVGVSFSGDVATYIEKTLIQKDE